MVFSSSICSYHIVPKRPRCQPLVLMELFYTRELKRLQTPCITVNDSDEKVRNEIKVRS